MSESMTRAETTHLDDDAVAEFLSNDSGFFDRRPELLPELSLPAKSGAVVSLADRQAAILRDRNQQMHQRLSALIAVAKENDRTFAGMRDLVLALMDANTWTQLDAVLAEHFLGGFGADHAVCRIADPPESADCTEPSAGEREGLAPRMKEPSAGEREGLAPRMKESAGLTHVVCEPCDGALGRHADKEHPTCDIFRPDDYAAVFPTARLSGPGSIAIVPLRKQSLRGVLAIGAEDPNRFTADMGTVFLRFAGDALARTLTRLL